MGMPLVNTVSLKTGGRIFGGEYRRHIILCIKEEDPAYKTAIAEFTEAAKQFKGKYLFVHTNCKAEDGPNDSLLKYFGIDGNTDCPTYRILVDVNDKYVPSDAKLTKDAFVSFVNDVDSGSLKRHLNSEPVPEENNGEMTKLVGENFKEVVTDSANAVFVKFMAPWCGHCKSMAPAWEKLAAHFKEDPEVTIANCDGTLNEFEEVKVEGFPTIKFWPKGKGSEPMDYSGGRTLEEMVKFVEDNMGVSATVGVEEKDSAAENAPR